MSQYMSQVSIKKDDCGQTSTLQPEPMLQFVIVSYNELQRLLVTVLVRAPSGCYW